MKRSMNKYNRLEVMPDDLFQYIEPKLIKKYF